MRLLLVCSILGAIGAAGCTRSANTGPDAARTPDVGAVDVGLDAPAASCTTSAQCDDAITCTLDQCVAGNVCMHTPIDGMCNVAGGEHCDAVRGCTTMSTIVCNTDAECDDGIFCNGTEGCVGHACYHDMNRDCSDGNDCTVDSCDETIAHCTYTSVCDAGIVTTDSGPVCTPFVAPGDFDGTYFIAPAQNQGCGVTMYSLSRIVLTVSGTTASATGLLVAGSPVTMTGTISGNTFDVSYAACGSYHLTGTFDTCRETFNGHWDAMYGGGLGCGSCTTMSVGVTGLRS